MSSACKISVKCGAIDNVTEVASVLCRMDRKENLLSSRLIRGTTTVLFVLLQLQLTAQSTLNVISCNFIPYLPFCGWGDSLISAHYVNFIKHEPNVLYYRRMECDYIEHTWARKLHKLCVACKLCVVDMLTLKIKANHKLTKRNVNMRLIDCETRLAEKEEEKNVHFGSICGISCCISKWKAEIESICFYFSFLFKISNEPKSTRRFCFGISE